jgi:hypothetical protein
MIAGLLIGLGLGALIGTFIIALLAGSARRDAEQTAYLQGRMDEAAEGTWADADPGQVIPIKFPSGTKIIPFRPKK